MSAALVAAGTGGLAVATNSICNGIVQCMDASANNRMRVDRQKFDHELSIQSAQFTREREQNQHEIKEQFGKNFQVRDTDRIRIDIIRYMITHIVYDISYFTLRMKTQAIGMFYLRGSPRCL